MNEWDRVIERVRLEHVASVSARGWSFGWSCSCGKSSRNYDRTEGQANAGRDRHLKSEQRKIAAEVAGVAS